MRVGEWREAGGELYDASITVRETEVGVRPAWREADTLLGRLLEELLMDWVGESTVGDGGRPEGS